MDLLLYGKFRLKKAVTVCLLLVLLSDTAFSTEIIHQYDIPAQSLNNSLMQFATESNLELIFPADKIRGLDCKALNGQMTPEQALDKLLQDSGYQYRFINPKTITLSPQIESGIQGFEPVAPEFAKQAPGIKVLHPLTVMGKQPTDKVRSNISRPYHAFYTKSATRTDTKIKETPQSIQVITRSLIDDQGSLSVSESLKNISGVTVGHTQLTPSFDFTQIRGFKAEQLLDGFTQYYNSGDRESLVNIKQIEVLKGSNALLYGGGSGSPAGGLVNIVSKLPEEQVIREAGVKYGSYQYYQPYFDFNQPINEQLLFRLSAEYTHSGSHIDMLETERYNINPALTLTDNDDTSLILQGKISSWEQIDYQGLPAQGTVTGDFTIQPETYLGPKDMEPSKAEFYGVWGTLEHAFNHRWSLSLKARYSQSKFDQKVQAIIGVDGLQADQAFIAPSTWALFNTQLFQQQQELSFVGNILAKFTLGITDNKLLLGADYSQFEDEGFIDANSLPLGFIDLAQPQFLMPYRQPGAGNNNIFVVNTTYGGYFQLQSSLYDRLHLLAGVRLGHVAIDYKNVSPGFNAAAQTRETKILPRIGASLDVTEDMSWFVSYSEGMRGQPFINFVTTPEPELSRHVEGGIKFDFSNGLSGQVAVYQIDREHVAITDNSDPLRRSKTTGKQRSQGGELDLTWQLNNSVSFLASYAYTDARYIKHQTVSSNGQPIPHIPRHSGKIWANYQFDQAVFDGLSLGIGVYAQSGVYLENSQYSKADSFYSVDAALNYKVGNVEFSAAIKNLTNEHYFESLNYFGGRFVPSQPISAYLNLSFHY